jgi:D-serine deaminase-like pyridoxal phosphate-dependent protein
MTSQYQQYSEALTGVKTPALYLDEEALAKNIDWVLRNAGGKKIRVATKSIRSVSILKKILEASPVFQGLMTFTLEESLWLREQGFKDLLIGYPTVDSTHLKILAQDPSEIILMVDDPRQIEILKAHYEGRPFSICLDIDLSMDLPGVRFGVFRSPLKNLERIKNISALILKTPEVRLLGLMGYEAQIAGVMDKESFLMRFLKSLSIPQLRKRRREIFHSLINEGHKLPLINGGGTGSLKNTSEESIVTEVTIGSAFFAPVLFDHYQSFSLTPAVGFALSVVRNPEPGVYTCLGGGYIASGAMEKIKTPTPYLPAGLRTTKNEGAGEVQTPLLYSGSEKLEIGSLVFLRHAKAGEACEHFQEIHVINRDKLVTTIKTYRGDGQRFL